MARIHVQWTWWPGSPTPEALWKSVDSKGHGYRTHHAGYPSDIHCMCVCTILLEKCCVHRPCSLNNGNHLILQLVQVPWFVTVPSTKIGPTCLCLLTAHHTEHFVGWRDASTSLGGFSKAQNFVFCLFTNPSTCAVRHLAQYALFTGPQIPDILAPSGATFDFYH
jgi:hypothetical protein